MKVLMYCLSSVSGGAVSYIQNLTPLLNYLFLESSEGHELKFLAHRNQAELFPSIPNAQIIWIDGSRPTGYFRALWEYKNMATILSDYQTDVVFAPYQIGPQTKGLKHVLMIRNMEPFLYNIYRYSVKSRLRNYLLRRKSENSLRNSDRVIAVSEFTEAHLKDRLHVSPERIHRIYHGKDNAFSPDGDLEKDMKILKKIGVEGNFLLTCGSLLPYRRCEDIINAFNRSVCINSPEIKLVIAGSGNDKKYANKIWKTISNSPFNDRIVAVGHVSKEVMAALYRQCIVFIIASEIEACPNIAIEAMSSGCAIVSSDCPPLPEILRGCTLEFIARDIEEMGRQICACIEDENLRKQISRRAIARSGDFSWQRCAEETYSTLVDWPKR
jgi:glycosyltransferase involved in cell wall biosynthesis